MKRARRGAVAVLLALALMVIAGVGALVLDLGYARVVQAQLQAAVDAAALGGVAALNHRQSGMLSAHRSAAGVAALNIAHGDPVLLNENLGNYPNGDVIVGVWANGAFVPTDDPLEANAVSVTARIPGLRPWLSRLAFGRERLGVSAQAIAAMPMSLGAGEVPWYLPFGLPMCLWDHYEDPELMDMTFVLNPAGVDNTGWAMVDGSPNANWIRDHLDQVHDCMWAWYETGQVDEACATASTSQDLGLNNGENSSGLRAIGEAIEAGVPWDPEVWGELPPQAGCSGVAEDAYGHMLVGPIPVFDGGEAYCTDEGGQWAGDVGLDGFVWAAVYDACWKGNAAQSNVYLRIDLASRYEVGTWPGGGDYGVVADGPAVVVR